MVTSQPHINRDEWLAQILGKDAFCISVSQELLASQEYRNELKQLLECKNIFIYAKVPTTSLAAVQFLEQNGFRLVDTNILFQKERSEKPILKGLCTLRNARPTDEQESVELASKSFQLSRFHLDPLISREAADRIKGEWVRNYFRKKRGDYMILAFVEEKLAGFLQLINGPDRILTIDLIAVDPDQRRKGIGNDLIVHAETEFVQFAQIKVGTQIANVPSLRLYENLGFRVVNSQYVFHFHQ
jgi:dTDP-4-amino-4,6-dideoxy-D-galactose acyltransferase